MNSCIMFRTGTLGLIVTSVLMVCVCGQRREDNIYRLLGDRLKALELDYGEALSSVESARSKLKYKSGLQSSVSGPTVLSATLLSTKCTTGQPLSGAQGPSHDVEDDNQAMAAKERGANYQPPVKPDEPQYYVDDN